MLHIHTVPKTCPQPEVEHGSVEVIRRYTSYYAEYTCDVGYELRGLWWTYRYRKCNLLTGEWVGTAPTCEECKLFKCSPQVYLQGIT